VHENHTSAAANDTMNHTIEGRCCNIMREDILLKEFFDKKRWENAIQTGIEKDIDLSLLRELSLPENRLKLYRQIVNGEYVIAPPHEAQIPKDDGTFRTVYVNESIDRIILSIVNDMLFELCPEMIHPACVSYQKNIGCGKIVKKISRIIQAAEGNTIGRKIDLSKYFDSVPIQYIDGVFDSIEQKYGKSKLLDIVRTYYHTDTVLDMDKKPIEKYSSLRQGCSVAAFLADAVLYDVDEAVSQFDVLYVRYSDDILIVGHDWEKAYAVLEQKLAEKSLILNPKKVETLHKNRWFKFLGFMIKNDMITISGPRLKTFQHEIEKRTVKNKSNSSEQILNAVYQYLYKGNGEYSWAVSILPYINVDKDIQTMNGFVMDAVRAGMTGRTKIGGLGSCRDMDDCTILRGKGRNVLSNKQKIPVIPHYVTIKCMQNAYMTSKEAYNTLVANI
jgi:hypothetical protein